MIRFFQKLKRKKGFTLVEMTCVMAIIAVISSMMLPTVTHYFTDAKVVTANASAAQIRKAVTGFLLDLNLQGKGMKRGKHLNAQMIFMCSEHKWMAKAEAKIAVSGGWDNDGDGSKTFNDHKNWWDNGAVLVPDNTSIYSPNHLLAMARLVSEMLGDIRSGMVAVFFNDSVCRGVVYMPEYTYGWPQTKYDKIPENVRKLFKQANGQPLGSGDGSSNGLRPALLKGRTEPVACYALKEFCPWNGVWPEYCDFRIWEGQAGVDVNGYVVGTSPTIGYTDKVIGYKEK